MKSMPVTLLPSFEGAPSMEHLKFCKGGSTDSGWHQLLMVAAAVLGICRPIWTVIQGVAALARILLHHPGKAGGCTGVALAEFGPELQSSVLEQAPAHGDFKEGWPRQLWKPCCTLLPSHLIMHGRLE